MAQAKTQESALPGRPERPARARVATAGTVMPAVLAGATGRLQKNSWQKEILLPETRRSRRACQATAYAANPVWYFFRVLAKMTILKPSQSREPRNTESLILSFRCGPEPRCDRKLPFEHSGSRQTNKRFPCGRQSRKRPGPRLFRPQCCPCCLAGQERTRH